MTPAEASTELKKLMKLLDGGLDVLRSSSVDVADAERDYRKAKALAWLEAEGPTAAQREAWVDAETAELRHARDTAENMRRAAIESIRARSAAMSAVQTLLNAYKSEADFARTGPE